MLAEIDYQLKASDKGLTDRQMHSALREMGYDFYNSNKTVDWCAMSEMAINEGYKWNEEKGRWFY